ncbi:MAG: hypothetical protein V1846_04365 [Candidatus Komeilibacteria bacterium]
MFIVFLVLAAILAAVPASAITLPLDCLAAGDTLSLQYLPDCDARTGVLLPLGPCPQQLSMFYMGGQNWIVIGDQIYGVVVDNPAFGVIRYVMILPRCHKSVLRFGRWQFPGRRLVFHNG